MNARSPNVAYDLALVFAVALGFRLMWVALIPPWASPDEPAHFTYAAHIAEQRELPHPPPHDGGYPDISDEVGGSYAPFLLSDLSCTAPPCHNLLPYLPVRQDYRPVRSYTSSPDRRLTAAGSAASDYPPLYYLVTAVFYSLFHDAPLISRILAARVSSAFLGALSCCFGYLFAYELTRRRSWGHALGISMALMPMYVFMNASVNNDTGVFMSTTALCWLLARLSQAKSLSPRLACAIGVASGASLMMKPSAIGLVVIAGTVVLYRTLAMPAKRPHMGARRAVCLATYAAGVLITAGPWMTFRLWWATSVAADATTDGVLVESLLSTPHHSFVEYLRYKQSLGVSYLESMFITTYWAAFGWMDVSLPVRVYRAIEWVYAAVAVGLVAQWLRRPALRWTLTWTAGLILGHAIFIFVIADFYLSFALTGEGLGVQGRYFFPTLAPLLFLILSGLSHLCRNERLVLRVVPLGMLVLQMFGASSMLTRYYGVVLL